MIFRISLYLLLYFHVLSRPLYSWIIIIKLFNTYASCITFFLYMQKYFIYLEISDIQFYLAMINKKSD